MMNKVSSGDPLKIPAGTFNTFVDASQDFLNRRHGVRSPGPATGYDGTVLIRNDSGSDLDRFSVLGIDDALVISPADNLDAFKNQPLLAGVTPDEALHRGRYVILAEPAKSGAFVAAYATGVVPVRLEVTQETDRWAEMKDGSTTVLKTGATGSAQILCRATVGEGEEEEEWALVRLPFDRPVLDETFAGCCKIQEDTPDTAYPNQDYIQNAPGGAWEERLLVKAVSPFGLPRNVKEFAFFVESWTIEYGRPSVAGALSMATPGLEFRPIIEDFDYEGDECATWNTRPATSEVGKASCGPLGEFTAYTYEDESVGAVKVWGGYGFRWGWGQGADGNTLTCYGIEIRAVNVDIIGGNGGDLTSITGIRESFDDFGRLLFW